MAYVAIKGGAKAIEGSKLAYDFLRSRQGEGSQPLDTSTIENQVCGCCTAG